ncbi:DNA polymerase III subunit beta [Alicyclobacillus contaminans]|uniref:DNA polymerase III subunit beta n=1 Tax=Alicyclobacillus contaminans TaxID=392016 RepID=UPI0004045148|nr:DNA polymerase III subunit beta [Alicyclobacillus contaminans]GMA50740.1 DNA polymerase III subunit beta [Alicyclobacillus contaminans]
MKLSIRKHALLEAIQVVSKAVAVRTPKQVLTGILLTAESNRLVATAYDLELAIQTHIEINEDTGLSVIAEGSIVLPARYFADMVRKLPEDQVTLQVDHNYMTEITSGLAQFHLHGIDAAEFPKLPEFHGAQSLNISSDLLHTLITSTSFAAANTEVRPILTGIHVVCDGRGLTFTATDGLRLATRSAAIAQTQTQPWNAIIPAKSLAELAKLLPDSDESITMQITHTHSLFMIGTTNFYTRMIDGAYPDTTRIIPTSSRTELIVNTTELMNAIDRAALIARERENNMVRLQLDDTTITVSSSSPEIGNVSESLKANAKTGDDMAIAFNAKYVLDALKALRSSEVVVRFNGWNQPFTFREVGNEEFGLQLISPVLMR